MIANCINLTNQPMRLKAGFITGIFTGVRRRQVVDLQLLTHCKVSDIKVTLETS